MLQGRRRAEKSKGIINMASYMNILFTSHFFSAQRHF